MYYRTDEEVEAADALSMAHRMVVGVATDPKNWRWLIIALHNAVQGFMVLSLRKNSLAALHPEYRERWLKAHAEDQVLREKEKLDDYLALFEKVKGKGKEGRLLGHNKPFKPSGSQGGSIKRLNALRNEFIHFTPKGWSLELDGLPKICLDCLALVSFLGWESRNTFWHSEEQLERARVTHKLLQAELEALVNLYKSVSG